MAMVVEKWLTQRVTTRLGDRHHRLAGDEPAEQMWARRAVVHPYAEVQRVERCYDPAWDADFVTVTVRLDRRLLLENSTLADAGDCGGAADRMIAQAARIITGETEPTRVCETLGKHHVRKASDLPRALGLDEGDAVGDDMRQQIADALGLAEPPLPAWVVPGVRVKRNDWGREGTGKVTAVSVCRGRVTVRDDGAAGLGKTQPAGIFLRMWEPADAFAALGLVVVSSDGCQADKTTTQGRAVNHAEYASPLRHVVRELESDIRRTACESLRRHLAPLRQRDQTDADRQARALRAASERLRTEPTPFSRSEAAAVASEVLRLENALRACGDHPTADVQVLREAARQVLGALYCASLTADDGPARGDGEFADGLSQMVDAAIGASGLQRQDWP